MEERRPWGRTIVGKRFLRQHVPGLELRRTTCRLYRTISGANGSPLVEHIAIEDVVCWRRKYPAALLHARPAAGLW